MKTTEEFLRDWNPGEPVILTAIHPDSGAIETVPFTDLKLMNEWITTRNATCNIYFLVNPVLRAELKKAGRQDIKAMTWLHIDIDPRPDCDLDEERARIEEALRCPPDPIPPPTVIVFSGGGYQGYWRLAEPYAIDGDLDKAETAKLYNQQIEKAFGADSCHNVDRIMRVPGTTNWPNEKKRKRGQKPEQAALVLWDEERVYDLDAFPTPARSTVNHKTTIARGEPVQLEKIQGIEDDARMYIEHDADPANPTRFKSRSEALFFVVCSLLRSNVPDETIMSILLDPRFAVSASVLEKGAGAERYAQRQIERGRAANVHPMLVQMNDEFAYLVSHGGRPRIMWWPHGAKTYELLTQEAFYGLTRNREVMIGNSPTNAGDWWMKQPLRRTYTKLEFAPGEVVPEYVFNTWQGFAVEPKQGDWSKMQAHMRYMMCETEEQYQYLLGWMAYAVQHPNEPGHVAIVLRGNEGVGKGTWAEKVFGALFGPHFVMACDIKHLAGAFNAHLQECSVFLADEASITEDKTMIGTIKRLVTENWVLLERKGVDAVRMRNRLHIVVATNNDWAMNVAEQSRRFFCLNVKGNYKDEKERVVYFKPIYAELERGGHSAMLYDLLHHDLSNFNVRDFPSTQETAFQKNQSLSDPFKKWLLTMLQTGDLPCSHQRDMFGIPKFRFELLPEGYWISKADFYALAEERMGRGMNTVSCGMFLSKLGVRTRRRRDSAQQTQGYLFDTLINMRRAWDCCAYPQAWSEDTLEWSTWAPTASE